MLCVYTGFGIDPLRHGIYPVEVGMGSSDQDRLVSAAGGDNGSGNCPLGGADGKSTIGVVPRAPINKVLRS